MRTASSSSTAVCHRLAAAGAAVDDERFRDLVADGEDRVERRHRLLKDERDLGAAHLAHLRFGQRQQIAVLEPDAAAGDPSRRLHEAHQRQRRDRLAAARFADQPKRFPGSNLEAHVVDRRDRAARLVEHGREMRNRQQRHRPFFEFAEYGPHRVGDLPDGRAGFHGRHNRRHEIAAVGRRLARRRRAPSATRPASRPARRARRRAICRGSTSGSI